MSIRWNDHGFNYYRLKKGLYKDHPMSHYLFVLCIDKLSHMICEVVNRSNWMGIKAGRRGQVMSHLIFVDDLLLIGKGTRNQMECVNNVLTTFF